MDPSRVTNSDTNQIKEDSTPHSSKAIITSKGLFKIALDSTEMVVVNNFIRYWNNTTTKNTTIISIATTRNATITLELSSKS